MRATNLPPWPPGAGWRRDPDAAPPPEMRVSDAERHEIADALSTHFADGRLDQQEFDERMGQAMSAKTRGDLSGLLRDLPALPATSPVPAAGRTRRRSRALVVALVAASLAFTTGSWAWGLVGWGPWEWNRPRAPMAPILVALVVVLLVHRSRRHHRHGGTTL